MSRKNRSKTTNPYLIELINMLKKKARENEAPIWGDIAERLSKPRRKRNQINLSRLNRYTQESDEAIIPGKILGAGSIDHPVIVAAFDFSDQAKKKILKAKGKCLTIPDLMKMNPKGTNVKIIG